MPVSTTFLPSQGAMTSATPEPEADATRHDPVDRQAAQAAQPANGITAEISAGYLIAIAPPAEQADRGPRSEESDQALVSTSQVPRPRAAAQISAAW